MTGARINKDGRVNRRHRRDPEVAARREQVAVLWERGLSYDQMARELGCTYGQILSAITALRKAEVEFSARKQRLDDDRIQQLWNFGYSASDIARQLGASPDSVRHVMQRMREAGVELYPECDLRRCS